MKYPRPSFIYLFAWTLALLLSDPAFGQRRAMTFQDVMQFRAIHDPEISADGRWIAFEARPDRGDGETVVRSVLTQMEFVVERGRKPVFSKDSRWLGVRVEPSWQETEKASRKQNKDEEKPKPGLALLDLETGKAQRWERIDQFAFSDDSGWMGYLRPAEKVKGGSPSPDTAQPKDEKKKKTEEVGGTLFLRELATGAELELPFVKDFVFRPKETWIVYSTYRPEGVGNGVFYRRLSTSPGDESVVYQSDKVRTGTLVWGKEGNRMAFLSAPGQDGKDSAAQLRLWDTRDLLEPVQPSDIPEGWIIPFQNELAWSKDGTRLFFGYKPSGEGKVAEEEEEREESEREVDPYDIESILRSREVDVWHWNDDWISPQQKKLWKTVQERTYRAVLHVESGRAVQLADLALPRVELTENPDAALGWSDVRYLKETTWGETYRDLYLVDLTTGARTLVSEKNASDGRSGAELSPDGGYLVYYDRGHWYLFNRTQGQTRNLTEGLPVSFADEDDDYPGSDPGYGVGGWVEGDAAVLIYDKYDIWEFPTGSGPPLNLTAGKGRAESTVFRLVRTDPEQESLEKSQQLLLTGYRDLRKNNGFYSAVEGQAGVSLLLEEDRTFRFVAKAKEANSYLFTRESYSEFPDLWLGDADFQEPRRLTNVNPQISEFAWGSAELVEWNSWDGRPLQGVLIKPGNYQPGQQYPVLVYFYRFFSQRLHEFNQPVVNHRPCFPLYASNGYAIFLPDIRFEIGRPGLSSAKSLIPGVQRLIDMGIANPEAVGLHGHSWSGYQTAFIVTQTDLFAAAIAGAPVSNMTSAYGGIRWGSGKARQFQYEVAQSRIGANLWEDLPAYIENSPLFYADRINTPLLIEFGDEDEAVPWYQGIELYLALRRLQKDCVFLQYRGEPHHPQKYANKLDYAMKMKEYLDHYLKKIPAPEWISKGVPYAGK